MDIFHLSPLHWSSIQTAIAHMMWSCQAVARPQPQSCHFRFNLRKREIAWEIFMQIRRVLRDYLATALMDVSFLEVNLTFCFSCQKGGLCDPICLWMTEDACWTSYMPVNPGPVLSGGLRRPQWGSPLCSHGKAFQVAEYGWPCYPRVPPPTDQKYSEKNPEHFKKHNKFAAY